MYMQARSSKHTTTHVHKHSTWTGTISASSLPHSTLCSSHFPPFSDSFVCFTIQSSACSSFVLRGERAEREWERGSCPLWVAKRLLFERSNPLHHTSHNLLCSHITLWEPVSASSACLAPPLLLSSSLPIRLFLLHL